ncbi:hypothetical protein CEUSTIGMA_g9263.t1 [Chlamydomonas eustigma]|uniref:EF-hand domain-containing protein n=1 Tax=Chlamydomonas eustigma TaxID=1157962 RepID=A0A250XFI3_9CHLO|nr:hypothetical protein CEUSTIGMA_g9263.t1 [Chlamydomonas eustigma]|eukprot:GAX81835.1 hypothetical protein CEUSTIGMA_g9263.t1 [Chlamydomonas eustigma]
MNRSSMMTGLVLPDQTIIQACKAFSTDGGESLTKHEFKCAYTALFGNKPVKTQWDLLPKVVSAEGIEMVTSEAFSTFIKGSSQYRDTGEHERTIFKLFDIRRSGFISREDAHTVFKGAAPGVPTRVVEEVFDELDLDQDGRVSCHDFLTMIRMRTP